MEVTTSNGAVTITKPDRNEMIKMFARTLYNSLRRAKVASVVPSDVRDDELKGVLMRHICCNINGARQVLAAGVEQDLFQKQGKRYHLRTVEGVI